jgi:uncharacterized Zn finger protein
MAMIRRAVLPCPSCGEQVSCEWPDGSGAKGRYNAAQRCGACGHEFDADWPGFTFQPERVIVRRHGEVPSRERA